MRPGGLSAAVLAAVIALPTAALRAQTTRAVATSTPLPDSRLAVRDGEQWITWWTADRAPTSWPAARPMVAGSLVWHRGAAGADWGEFVVAGSGEAWRTRVIVARLDPSRLRFRLDTAFARPWRADWSLARAPTDAVAAFNAGQFVETMPWGWVMLDGREFLPPGAGPLVTTVAIDSAGGVHWWPADSLAHTPPLRVRWAFQSYPALLEDGVVPMPLRAAERGVDVAHRDARLALGRLRDGRLLVVLTRFDALGETLGFVPFGLTVPEMAALMGALGCRDAVLLDGGISAQLLVRDAAGAAHEWRGVRRVPLGLIAIPR